MKFFFLKTDSLYKIFKTLEKVPSQKAVQIFIDPEHPFFENQWRGKQLQDLIKERNLNITFLAEKESNRKYFQQLGLQVHYEEEKPIIKMLKTLSVFLFDFKRFHLHAFAGTQTKQKYLFYMVFFFEALAGIGLVWFLFLSILPSAKVTLKVAQNTEDIIYNFRYYPAENTGYSGTIKQISIPYFKWSLNYNYQLAISTENIQHIIDPSAWFVKIYNKTSNAINLLANTRFVTHDGLTFLSKAPITIPAWLKNNPSELKIRLYADETDEQGLLMGVRGNVPKGTKMTIKNIKDSFYLGQIWAEAIEPFTWGRMTALGTISEKDRETLSEKIKNGVYKDKLNIVSKEFNLQDALVLMFDELIKTKFHSLSVDGKIGERATSLRGMAQVSFDFFYLKWSDIVEAFTSYVQQRQSDSIQLISINPNTLAFIQDMKWITDNQVFMIPTKVTILQGYDFQKDIKWIIPSIKEAIAGKTVEEARKIILQYSEIASVKIDLGLMQGGEIPTVKSRIKVKVEL